MFFTKPFNQGFKNYHQKLQDKFVKDIEKIIFE